MEYNLNRKKKLTSVLTARIYKVHDRADFAEVTRNLLTRAEEKIRNPLHYEIQHGYAFKLRPVTPIEKIRLPSLETIQTERILEGQRLEKIAFESKVAQQIEPKLKSKAFLVRRPLPPSAVFKVPCADSC